MGAGSVAIVVDILDTEESIWTFGFRLGPRCLDFPTITQRASTFVDIRSVLIRLVSE